MNEGRTIFSQLLEHAPHDHFRQCVERYCGNLGLRSLRSSRSRHCELSLYTMLQILSLSFFEKAELPQVFSRAKVAM
jgi:hypothetical protein